MNTASRRMRSWLLVTGATYALGAIDFIARPRAAPATLGLVGGQPIEPEEPPGLYNALAASYMATIAGLALSAARDPQRYGDLIPPLLVAKAASTATLLHRYQSTRRLGFAAGAALDAIILGVTAGLYASLER